jgi:hypothetical protein
MANVRFDLNPDLERDVQPLLVPLLDDVAKDMASDASALGRAEAYGLGLGGHYATQINGTAELVNGWAEGRVEAAKFTAWWLEKGTRFMEGRHILERTARKSGLPIGGRRPPGRGRR